VEVFFGIWMAKSQEEAAVTQEEQNKQKQVKTQDEIRNALHHVFVMTQEDWQAEALRRVADANPDITDPYPDRVYDNFLDGILVTVVYKDKKQENKQVWSYIHFRDSETRFYRNSSEVLFTVNSYRERIWFFRFLEFVGTGGFIAFLLILMFSVILCILAFSKAAPENDKIVDVIRVSFTIILGYFFGQASHKKK
jgi:hypothetical protein